MEWILVAVSLGLVLLVILRTIPIRKENAKLRSYDTFAKEQSRKWHKELLKEQVKNFQLQEQLNQINNLARHEDGDRREAYLKGKEDDKNNSADTQSDNSD